MKNLSPFLALGLLLSLSNAVYVTYIMCPGALPTDSMILALSMLSSIIGSVMITTLGVLHTIENARGYRVI